MTPAFEAASAASPAGVRRLLRSDRAATDPILVIAAIAVSLVLLVGGSFTVSALIANGKQLNARADLDHVATAQEASAADGTGYVNFDSVSVRSLPVTVSDGGYAQAKQCTAGSTVGWVAAARSSDGTVWVRSSASPATAKAPAADLKLPGCANAATVAALTSAVAARNTTVASAHLDALTAVAGIAPVVDLENPTGPNEVYRFPATSDATWFVAMPNDRYHWIDLGDGSRTVQRLTTQDGNQNAVTLLSSPSNAWRQDVTGLNNPGALSVVGGRYKNGYQGALITRNGVQPTNNTDQPRNAASITVYDVNTGYELVVFPAALSDTQATAVRDYLAANHLGG